MAPSSRTVVPSIVSSGVDGAGPHGAAGSLGARSTPGPPCPRKPRELVDRGYLHRCWAAVGRTPRSAAESPSACSRPGSRRCRCPGSGTRASRADRGIRPTKQPHPHHSQVVHPMDAAPGGAHFIVRWRRPWASCAIHSAYIGSSLPKTAATRAAAPRKVPKGSS